MVNPEQSHIVYLMFLNGILFLGLNFIAYSMAFPGGKGSKRIGYVLIVAVILAYTVTQEFRYMVELGFDSSWTRNILLGGFVTPVFLISLVYYRIKKQRSGPSHPIQGDSNP